MPALRLRRPGWLRCYWRSEPAVSWFVSWFEPPVSRAAGAAPAAAAAMVAAALLQLAL